jgi:hypothetical protein
VSNARRARWCVPATTSYLVVWLAVFAMTSGFLHGVARAEPSGSIDLQITVARISEEPGPVDAAAGRLARRLRQEFKFESLQLLEKRKMRLTGDEVGKMKLPGGGRLLVSPLQLSEGSVLLAVDVEGLLKTDLRAESGQLVIIGAGRFEGGKLVIALEPRF